MEHIIQKLTQIASQANLNTANEINLVIRELRAFRQALCERLVTIKNTSAHLSYTSASLLNEVSQNVNPPQSNSVPAYYPNYNPMRAAACYNPNDGHPSGRSNPFDVHKAMSPADPNMYGVYGDHAAVMAWQEAEANRAAMHPAFQFGMPEMDLSQGSVRRRDLEAAVEKSTHNPDSPLYGNMVTFSRGHFGIAVTVTPYGPPAQFESSLWYPVTFRAAGVDYRGYVSEDGVYVPEPKAGVSLNRIDSKVQEAIDTYSACPAAYTMYCNLPPAEKVYFYNLVEGIGDMFRESGLCAQSQGSCLEVPIKDGVKLTMLNLSNIKVADVINYMLNPLLLAVIKRLDFTGLLYLDLNDRPDPSGLEAITLQIVSDPKLEISLENETKGVSLGEIVSEESAALMAEPNHSN